MSRPGVDAEDIALRVARHLYAKTGRVEPLEDLQQEARLAVFLAEQSFDPSKGERSAYLYTVARQRVYDYLRGLHGRDLSRHRFEQEPVERKHEPTCQPDTQRIDDADSVPKARRLAKAAERELRKATAAPRVRVRVAPNFSKDFRKMENERRKRMAKRKEQDLPMETPNGPGKIGGPVVVCGLLLERIPNGVLITLPEGRSVSCSLVVFTHAMALLLSDKETK